MSRATASIATISGAAARCERLRGSWGLQHLVDKRLDAGEKGCGELLILVFKAMKAMQPGDRYFYTVLSNTLKYLGLSRM